VLAKLACARQVNRSTLVMLCWGRVGAVVNNRKRLEAKGVLSKLELPSLAEYEIGGIR